MFLNLLEKILNSCYAIIPREKPSIEAAQSVRIIAHRGAHDHAQSIIENTLPAFGLAQDLGCWGIEFDVRATADKVLVVNHDASLKRLWGHNQLIANLSFNELRALVPDVPTLNEVVAAYGDRMHLFIELKAPFQDEEVLGTILHGLAPGENYHLISLNSSIFYSLSQFPKDILLLVAGLGNVQEFCNICLKENYGGVLAHYLLLTNKTINRLRIAEKNVGVGPVESKYSLYRELNRGINWLFTNHPAEINAYLRQIK